MLNGRELRWHFENLEPTAADNLEVSLVWPDDWQQILAKQQAVQNHPTDGEAWGRLAKAYKELLHCSEKAGIRSDEGGQELYRLSMAAYEKSVTLLPRDALWHAGFAELLMCHYAYSYPERETADMIRGLDELNQSVALAPDNQPAQDLVTWSKLTFPDEIKLGPNGYYFLTPTLRPLPTFTLTSAPPPAKPTTEPHQERDTATAKVE